MSITSTSTHFTGSSHAFTNSPAWLLGQCYKLLSAPPSNYHPIPGSHSAPSTSSSSSSSLHPSAAPLAADRRAAFMGDLVSKFWFSYRSGFPSIHSSYEGVTSDAGWGCMIRSTQMMLAYAFTLHYLGRGWRRGVGGGGAEKKEGGAAVIDDEELQQQIYLSLLSWFLDSPSSPYSIHALLTTPSLSVTPSSSSAPSLFSPASASTPRVGEWFGPFSTCQMLLRCRAAQVAAAGGEAFLDVPLLMVADDGTIYWDKVVRHCVTRGKYPPHQPSAAALHSPADGTGATPSAPFSFDPSTDSFHPLILFIPLRLGVDKLNPAYLPSLLSIFQYPQTIGMMGGKPRTSFYFIGVQDDRLLYLDPHTVQPALPHSSHLLRTAECATFHTSKLYSMPATAIDPSLAIGFYLRTWEDWTQLAAQARRMEEHDPTYAVVRVREKRGWKGRDEREEAEAAEAALQAVQQAEEEFDGEEEEVDDGERVEAEDEKKEEKSVPQRRSQSTPPRSQRPSRGELSGSRSSRAAAAAEAEEDEDFVLL